MAFVQFSQVSLAFGDRDILKDVSVHLASGTKAALTGANGSGKSTLIKIMAGIVPPDSGQRVAQKGARIAYLPQSGLAHKGRTLREEADTAFGFGHELMAELDGIGDALKAGSGSERALLERHDAIIEELESSGWNRRRATAEQVLSGLGFSAGDLDRRCEEFSGGWQMRIALAKSLMANPHILLLDEPTNYLDIEARGWLESFLNDFKGGFLLVSHDRYFLDHTITEVYELFGGELRKYAGTFSHYEEVRKAELETLVREYEKQRAEIQRLQEFIARFGAKATKAAQAQERQKMLDKILENEIVIPEPLKKIRFSFPAAPHSGRIVAALEGMSKSYGGAPVLRGLDLLVESGDRLVVAGRNGAGKSTLLRIIAGADADFSGGMRLGAGVSLGYFSQDSSERLAGSQSVLSEIEGVCPLELVPRARDLLGAFLFRGDDVFKPLDVLSGGEKSRVALLKLLLRPVNLLVLDEPTNHLDIHSKDVLLDALRSFGGTVVFVSHDRAFIESLATRVLELKDGAFRLFPGGYDYYVRRLEDERSGAVPRAGEDARPDGRQPGDGGVSEGKRSWQERKRAEAERRRAEKLVAQIEEEIGAAEAEKRAQEELLSSAEVYSDGERAKAVQKRIGELALLLAALSERWEKAALALEELG